VYYRRISAGEVRHAIERLTDRISSFHHRMRRGIRKLLRRSLRRPTVITRQSVVVAD
jgi:hypothetical protein